MNSVMTSLYLGNKSPAAKTTLPNDGQMLVDSDVQFTIDRTGNKSNLTTESPARPHYDCLPATSAPDFFNGIVQSENNVQANEVIVIDEHSNEAKLCTSLTEPMLRAPVANTNVTPASPAVIQVNVVHICICIYIYVSLFF